MIMHFLTYIQRSLEKAEQLDGLTRDEYARILGVRLVIEDMVEERGKVRDE